MTHSADFLQKLCLKSTVSIIMKIWQTV